MSATEHDRAQAETWTPAPDTCACPPNSDAETCAALRDFGHSPVEPHEARECPCACHETSAANDEDVCS